MFRTGLFGGGSPTDEYADEHSYRLFNKPYKDLIPAELIEFNEEMDRLRSKFRGAKGGRVGRMGGGMMIIEDNDVVNNGMGAILNKYKQIRSEL